MQYFYTVVPYELNTTQVPSASRVTSSGDARSTRTDPEFFRFRLITPAQSVGLQLKLSEPSATRLIPDDVLSCSPSPLRSGLFSCSSEGANNVSLLKVIMLVPLLSSLTTSPPASLEPSEDRELRDAALSKLLSPGPPRYLRKGKLKT